MINIADIRTDYKMAELLEENASKNAIDQFTKWWKEAEKSQIDEINAMTLCTVDANMVPHGRIVLLKGYTENGFEFFTNYESQKGKDLLNNPKASLVFFWKELQRQIRIVGDVEKLSREESIHYFHSRPRGSQIGAWASKQSTIIDNRAVLTNQLASIEANFENREVDKPDYWGGFRVVPQQIEFWQGRPSRLHDRLLYTRLDTKNWKIERLSP